ncbi:NYN domain-containing protein [Nocardioides alpinus]|nr:NYN domain-containing protein [Nocardioides alpinus]
MVEPRRAADTGDAASRDAIQDGDLTSLVRRWMATGTKVHERVRRDSILRVAPAPDLGHPETQGPETGADPGAYVVGTTLTRVSERADLVGGAPPVDGSAASTGSVVGVPRLPQRPTAAETEQVHRVALLIDARRIPADTAAALLGLLAERGAVNVCRAYADWNSDALGDWVGQMRREGLHSFHHFADDDDQALVAMTIDAVDIARDAAVDEVVIAGDLTSALPLVHRLHAAGVRVVAVGSGLTPHDVRAAAHEFIDTGFLDGQQPVAAGRHRA